MATTENEKVSRDEELAHSIAFHSWAHYLSADYYETFDRRLTYVHTFVTAIGSISSGGMILDALKTSSTPPASNKQTCLIMMAAIITVTAGVFSALIETLRRTDHNPAKRASKHSEAARQLRTLLREVEGFENRRLEDQEYIGFVKKQSDIEREIIKSEERIFEKSRRKMAPKYQDIAKRKREGPDQKSQTWRDWYRELPSLMELLIHFAQVFGVCVLGGFLYVCNLCVWNAYWETITPCQLHTNNNYAPTSMPLGQC